MQIHEVDPNARIEGFVRRFDLPNWRDVETNLYLTLSRATDLAPPEPKRPPYVDPYDDPYPLYRKVPGNPNSPPPIITTPHVIEKNLVYVDPKPMTGMVQNVLREYREHPNYILTAHAREYQEAMACFQLRSAVVQWPDKHGANMGEEDYKKLVTIAAKHLTLEDCPAQETVQLQITAQAAFHLATLEMTNNNRKRRESLDNIMELIVATKVVDIRKYYETAEVLRERVVHYLKEYSKHMEEEPGFSVDNKTEGVMEAELNAALESVFPRKGFLYWMDLANNEKVLQLEELAEVVVGIRIFNKYLGKGGHTLQLPFESYQSEAIELADEVQDALVKVTENIHGYSLGIATYLHEMGTNHMFIKRLRDELAYQYQAAVYLQPFNRFLYERHGVVSDLLEKCDQHLDAIVEIIGDYECIPGDMVFPKLRAVGAVQNAIAQELQSLRAHIKAAAPLIAMTMKPFYKPSPITERKLAIKQKNFQFLPRDPPFEDENEYQEAAERGCCKPVHITGARLCDIMRDGDPLEYGGFCAVCFVRQRGVLWRGDPSIGLVQTEDKKLYSFGDDISLQRFMNAPCKYIADVANLVKEMPQYVHIMNLEFSPALSYLSIPKIVETELVTEGIPKEFATQTDTHPWICVWDREKLHKRKLELENKKTHCTQTDLSHFRRDNFSQTWLPKEKWTNTGISRYTDMPRHVKVLHNLRGDMHTRMHTCKAKYEHTSFYNPFKVVPPFELITAPYC
ncbi:unnamed protein product [Sphagnum jensenii]|uniref:Cilia- and flagella-associated protein 206 n=1 Tax=Sphagnum jensenii TaxID=128206 RepID=A0ABP0WPA4_9BRYO